MNRRQYLQATAMGIFATVAGGGLLARAVAAPKGRKRKLIVVFNEGGWDVTVAVDPKTPGTLDVAPGAVAHYANYDIWADASRPAVSNFFAKHASLTSVIRGISMSSIAHAECRKRMLTGTRSAASADFAATAAHVHGGALPIPYLILGNTAFAGPYAADTGRVGQDNQLVALVDPTQAYRPVQGNVERLSLSEQERAAFATHLKARAAREAATRGQLGANRRAVEAFGVALDRAAQLRAAAPTLGTRGAARTFTALADVAVRALSTGLSHSVMIDDNSNWDTHDNNHQDQGILHERMFAGLTHLLDTLIATPGSTAGQKLIDETAVVVLSEMSRTPKLNAEQGKDHWPVTAALVIGAGVRGGQAFGASSAMLEATRVDYATGQPLASGEFITERNLNAGLLSWLGVSPDAQGLKPFDAFLEG